MLPFFFPPAQSFEIRDPGGREDAFAREPSGLPEAHALGIVRDDQCGDMEIGGEMPGKRIVSNDIPGFINEFC